jgi:GNAT superfamily N-acetyltransferase
MTTLQTPLGLITLEKAEREDLSLVMGILDDAAAWLHSRGIDYQWPSPVPESSWDRTERGIREGQVYLARTGDQCPVGTFRIEWRDTYEAWPHDPDYAGYVRSIAIRSSARGHNIGASMLEWARQHIRGHHRRYMRLRCCAENLNLCRYYEDLGFALQGQVQAEMWVASLYQMEVERALSVRFNCTHG